MNLLSNFHGPEAVIVLCALIFAEESGIPVPLAPGDLILLTAGLLIAGGELSPWMFVPCAILAATGGALTGYTWTRLAGQAGLRSLARRFGFTRHLDRLTKRLQSAGPAGILVCRLLPGMRINTTLVAGAAGVRSRTFVLGLIPAIILWVVSFTALGAIAGEPVVHVLSRMDRLALQAGILLAVAGIGYLAARHVPALRETGDSLLETPGWRRIVPAVGVDLAAIGTIVGGFDLALRLIFQFGRIDGWNDAAAAITAGILAYLLLARGGPGLTAGEAIFRVTYRARRLEYSA